MGGRNKRLGNKRDNDEVENVRSTHELLEGDTEEHDECKEDDDRDWQKKVLETKKTPRVTGGLCQRN